MQAQTMVAVTAFRAGIAGRPLPNMGRLRPELVELVNVIYINALTVYQQHKQERDAA